VIAAVWGFVKSPVGRWLIGIVGAVVVLVLIYQGGVSAGVQHEKAAEAKRIASVMKTVKKVEKGAEAITAATDKKAAERVVEIRTVTKTLVEKVPVYVTAETDRRYLLPDGLVRLRDQAAAGVSEVPAHPGELFDAPSAVPASAFAETLVLDYGTAHEWKEAALACRSWVSEQAENFNSNIRTPTAP
jgi:hypothetical protein